MTKKRARIQHSRPAATAAARALPKDVALVHGPTEDGEGARVLRFKEGAVYAGEVRPVREGKPVDQQEVVRLRPLHANLPLCEVEVVHAPEPRRDGAGPARVATDSYRRNWGTIFGGTAKPPAKKKGKPDLSLN
jgi:hypothetical protein